MLGKLKIFKSIGTRRKRAPDEIRDLFRSKYQSFKELLDSDSELSKIIADVETKLQGNSVFGMSYVRSQSARSVFQTLRMIKNLNSLSGGRYADILPAFEKINAGIKAELEGRKGQELTEWVLPYSRVFKEMVDWVGGKSANLGEVRNRAGLPVPEGFAVTTVGYEHFLVQNDLVDEINKIKMDLDPGSPESANAISENIQHLIISAPVPEDLSEAILSAYDGMARRACEGAAGAGAPRISMRSSAIGEDSELSFAGQYRSILNVSRDRIIQSYKFIIASLFTPRAISYRLMKGIRDEDVAMSVACLQMIGSTASGVIYTRHPINLLDETITISAVWGLGPYAVGGVITPDSYRVAKNEDLEIVELSVSQKPVQLAADPQGGLVEKPVPEELQNAPCLTPAQIRDLARFAMRIETHYGCPQDIEWALDEAGHLYILQTRPLRCEPAQARIPGPVPELSNYPVLLEGGTAAFAGIGWGKAYHVRSEEDLVHFPEQSVLIASRPSPKFVVVMHKAQAIVTDYGSITSHMASLSREFAIPTLLDTKTATASIPEGAEITVDSRSGRVFKGQVPELLSLRKKEGPFMTGTPVYGALRRIADRIIPLRLFDPRSASFTPASCESLHDLMRFVHEMSYAEMFKMSDLVSDREGGALRLDAPIPLDLYVIDVGGGLAEGAGRSSKIKPEQVVSTPFRALLKGMLHEDLRLVQPRPVEFRGFLSVMGEQMFTPAHTAERFGDKSYAIVSDKYLNFSSRVGYHYGVLDCYCGNTVLKNYVTFSFKGGAADAIRKNRRARAIALVLQALSFNVEVVADRVDARLQKLEAPLIEEKLEMVGRLLQFTRQLDMLMHGETSVNAVAESFLAGKYHL